MLSEEQLRQIEEFKGHPIGVLIADAKSWRWEVGDILIRTDRLNNQIDTINYDLPLPKKFKIIHIDDLGIPWVKRVRVEKGLGKSLHCIAMSSVHWKWQIDPELFVSKITDDDYDPRRQYKDYKEIYGQV